MGRRAKERNGPAGRGSAVDGPAPARSTAGPPIWRTEWVGGPAVEGPSVCALDGGTPYLENRMGRRSGRRGSSAYAYLENRWLEVQPRGQRLRVFGEQNGSEVRPWRAQRLRARRRDSIFGEQNGPAGSGPAVEGPAPARSTAGLWGTEWVGGPAVEGPAPGARRRATRVAPTRNTEHDD